MNKAKRILDNMEKEQALAITTEIGEIDEAATPLRQARYIHQLLRAAEKKNIGMVDTMRKCGGCCLSANAVKKAKAFYAKANSLDEFLAFLNEADIGGQQLHASGEKIIAVYQKCYCGIPKKVEGLHQTYCECSAGWYMRLFSEVFEKKVSVKIVDTIVNGAAECVFEITDFQ